MTALADNRNTPQLGSEALPNLFSLGVAASTTIYAGSLVMVVSGYAKPATATSALGVLVVGRADEKVDNASGSAGDKSVNVRTGVFRFGNSGSSDLIATANIGEDCYVVDDQTVALTDNTGARARAGTVVSVDDSGVWVLVGGAVRTSPRLQCGTATLAAGTITVSNVKLTASSRIVATAKTFAGTTGYLSAPAANRSVAGGFFSITSSTNQDTSTVEFIIID
jgi:hypothetical protein